MPHTHTKSVSSAVAVMDNIEEYAKIQIHYGVGYAMMPWRTTSGLSELTISRQETEVLVALDNDIEVPCVVQ